MKLFKFIVFAMLLLALSACSQSSDPVESFFEGNENVVRYDAEAWDFQLTVAVPAVIETNEPFTIRTWLTFTDVKRAVLSHDPQITGIAILDSSGEIVHDFAFTLLNDISTAVHENAVIESDHYVDLPDPGTYTAIIRTSVLRLNNEPAVGTGNEAFLREDWPESMRQLENSRLTIDNIVLVAK